jgi:hypothetical protein
MVDRGAAGMAIGAVKDRCRIRFYRSRAMQVYLPCLSLPMTKAVAWRRVKHAAWEPAALSHTPRFQCVQRNIPAPCPEMIGAQRAAACILHTTLVQEPPACDFSTDAGNSALIVNNEISAASKRRRIRNQERKFLSYPIGPSREERHVTEEA